MKRLVLFSLCVILWACSTTLKATGTESNSPQAAAPVPGALATGAADAERGFSHRVVGVAHLLDGTELQIDKELSFAQDTRGWYFRVGDQRVYRNTPPRAYNLNLILNEQGELYVPDFSERPLKYLRLTIENHHIELTQAHNVDTTYGMRLRIDDRQFLFDSSHPRIRFGFNERGLESVSAVNTIRDLTIRRIQ